jgi:hypothetical protein
MSTAGQRSVTMEDDTPTLVVVRDFNPYAVRAARALAATSGQWQQGNWSKQLPNGNRMSLKVEDSAISAGSIFEEDVRSSLPYIEIVTQAEYDYDGVLIDEESILGLRVRSNSCYVVYMCIDRIEFHSLQSSQDNVGWLLSFDVHTLG